jgi:tripartite-type tricarboxylate transporter receptor subunit TctC/acetylornithine deacetylase/succinyl-diaminopimelate desuccinylase-like protein
MTDTAGHPLPERETIARDIVATLSDLVAIDSCSPPGDTAAIGERLARDLVAAGYTVSLPRSGNSTNVVARLGRGKPSLVFNAHVDTVGPGDPGIWTTDPMAGTVIGDRLHGLGASNAKGAAASQVWVAREIARAGGPREGEVVFTFVGDEENLGPDGLARLRTDGVVQPDMLVVGAPTENQLIVAERGVLWAELVTTGRAAHAGAAPSGDNAITRMARVIAHIERMLTPAIAARHAASPGGELASMMNIGTIEGGEAPNVVPSRCVVRIDRRLLPTETPDAAFAELEAAALAAGEPPGSVTLKPLTKSAGFQSRDDGPMMVAFKDAIASHFGAPARFVNAVGVFDGRYFARDGIEIVDFGPGEGSQGHAPNESVPIGQLVDAALIQLDVVRRVLGLGVVLLALVLASLMPASPALAQGAAPRPVRIIVPFGPGAVDTIARVVGQQYATQTGQSVVIENRLGANGIIGTEQVVKAPPDGNTLLVVSASLVVNPSIYRKLPFDPLRDLAPVTNLCSMQAFILAVNPSVQARTAAEFVAMARKPDAQISYGSPGIGNTIHLAGALFNERAGLHMTHVPYKGGGPANAALLSGEIQAMLSNELLVVPYERAGRLRALAVTGHRRLASLPDVPTLGEAGIPGMDIDAGWFGLLAPAATPPEVIARINAGMRRALEEPAVRRRLQEQGFEPSPNSPEAFRSYLEGQLKLYAEMVRLAGVEPE